MKTGVLKTLKNQAYVSLMVLESVRVDEQVIEIGHHEIVKIFSKGVIDILLESAWGVAKTKGHNLILVKSIPTAKHCFPFFSMSNLKRL